MPQTPHATETTMLLLITALAVPAEALEWNQLRSDHAEASSYLKSNWNKYSENYHPSYVLDEDPTTAWVEGAEGNGEGESLVLPISALESARQVKLKVRNGYQKSEKLFYANSAPREVTITLLSGEAEVASFERTLAQTMGWQELDLAVPEGRGLSAVKIEVKSVHAGTSYKDTCVSDVLVYVDSDVAHDARVEDNKLDTVKGWIAERQATAAYFASQPTTYPFASTSYDYEYSDTIDNATFDQQVSEAQAKMEALKAQTVWYRWATSDPLVEPDGVWSLEHKIHLVDLDRLSFFEADDETGRHVKKGSEEDNWYPLQTWSSNYKIARDADGQITALYYTFREVVSERGTYETNVEVLVEYEAGELVRIYEVGVADDMEGEVALSQLIRFERDAEGRIATFDVRSHRRFIEPWEDMPEEYINMYSRYDYTGL